MGKHNHFDHIFCPVGDGVYLIKCTKTGGEFSSALWLSGKQSSQKCPCCNSIVEKHK